MTTHPPYDELPRLGELDVKSARAVLPPELGTLSRISQRDVAAASASVRDGISVSLNLPINAFVPALFGRSPLVHRVVEPARNEAEDEFDGFNPQSSSQLDGLAHVRAREHGFFDGSTELDVARDAIGMHHWARRGIVGRGVLLDAVPSAGDPFAGRAITAEQMLMMADAQGVQIRSGDILLVRTAWAARYLEASADERAAVTGWNGLSAGHDTARFLWDSGVAVIGSDNPAVENAPGDAAVGSLHRRLLPALGMPMMELLDLEALAGECRTRGRWDFLFVSVPLHAVGAVSSPANAVAIL